MPPSLITSVLIIAAISITIGYIMGWLIATLRGDKHSSKEAQPSASNEDSLPGRRILLQIWRDITDGSLSFELHGNQLANAKRLSLEERRELANLMKETGDWMGLPTESAPLQRLAGVDRGASLQVSESYPTGGAGASDVDSLRPSLIDGMTNVIADVVSPVQPVRRETPKSIVQQIDEILQEKLLGTPYEGQKIYITEDFRKGVIVWVGNSMYEGVGGMPEGEVKNLLRASVKEWERLQEQSRRRNDKS